MKKVGFDRVQWNRPEIRVIEKWKDVRVTVSEIEKLENLEFYKNHVGSVLETNI